MRDPARQPSLDAQKRVGYETRDASPLLAGIFGLGLALMIALVLPLLGWIFWRFEAAAQLSDPQQSPVAGNQIPPLPRLQNDPAADLAQFRREEDERLSSYGWSDSQKKVVRVPVARAIELLAERGFPEPEGPVELPPKEAKEKLP